MYKKPLLLLRIALLLLFIFPSDFALSSDIENRVKAAFLYKFCGYIEWPESVFTAPNQPIVIGVSGSDELAEDVRLTVAGRMVNGRTFEVKRIRRGDDVQNLQVLYIGRDSRRVLEDFIDPDVAWPILTITDDEKSSVLGIINFVVPDTRVRFLIDNQRANEVGLKISSQLLWIASQVDDGGAR